jgi:hypothetical protein
MNKLMKKSAVVTVMAFAIAGLVGTTFMSIPSADAATVAGQGNSQNAAQAGLVNANVGVGANVGNVCVNALASDTDQC